MDGRLVGRSLWWMPCSVNTNGRYCRPPLVSAFVVKKFDLKNFNSLLSLDIELVASLSKVKFFDLKTSSILLFSKECVFVLILDVKIFDFKIW